MRKSLAVQLWWGLGLAGLALTLAACKAVPTTSVRGTVTSSATAPMPTDGVLTLKLEEIISANSAPRVLVQQTLSMRGRQLPVAFELTTLASEVNADRMHRVTASLAIGTRQLYSTPIPALVLTKGAPDSARVVITPVSANPR